MLVPLSWLKLYANIGSDTKLFCDKITSIGMPVESAVEMGKEITGVVIGKVVSLEKHPGADKLFITQINVGTEILQIVTGADNLYPGAYVPVATDGSTLANEIKIKKGKLRGEISNGMLCSIEELGFTRNDYPESPENGIYIFEKEREKELVLGSDVKIALEISDTILDFDLTSNRPDCYSVFGMAREAAAAMNTPLVYPEISVKETAVGNAAEMISVDIQNADLCPRYVARIVKNIKIEPSPQWMRHRLSASGIRPINNIVDITNYVMLELGQPMHAFDIDMIDNRKIVVRNANEGEVFTTLDGEERKLDSTMLVIADPNKAVAIAGVMGGENSKVTGGASAVLFESATFDGANIRVTSKKLGLRTDSSGKYERGLDPNLAEIAVNRAVSLVEQMNCGEVVKGIVDCYPRKRESKTIIYDSERINKLLGTAIPAKDMEVYLDRLQIRTENNAAIIPTYRADMTCWADVAEEIARIYGYDNIPTTLASGTPTTGTKTELQKMEDLLKDTLVAQGLNEGLSYAFESQKAFDKLLIPVDSPLRNAVTILNPLGEDYNTMRTTTLNAMLTALSTNYSRRNEEANLFEIARVYLPKALPLTELPEEILKLTIGMYGVKTDFYDIKGVVESIAEVFGITDIEFVPEKSLPYMHPGRTASVVSNGQNIGYFGEVHPQVLENYQIDTKAYIAVINTDVLFSQAKLIKAYKPLPKFPGIKRDIAMLVKDEVAVKQIEDAIREKSGKFLEDIKLFDVYKGTHTPEGFKSVAYSVSFRAPDRTLTEEDVVSAMEKILINLKNKTGAQLRDK